MAMKKREHASSVHSLLAHVEAATQVAESNMLECCCRRKRWLPDTPLEENVKISELRGFKLPAPDFCTVVARARMFCSSTTCD